MPELTVAPGSVLLVPTNAVKVNDRLDDASEDSSVYSAEPDLAQDEEVYAECQLSDEELMQRLLRFGLDRNGLPLRLDLFFSSHAAAAAFTLAEEEVGFWRKLRGADGRNMVTPHVVLWDYFGGNTCLDLNVSANDVVEVIAEEFQVRHVANCLDEKRPYFRLPRKWSLVRWLNHKPFQPIVGLMPSCWLVQKSFFDNNRRFFRNSTWYIGISDLTTAYECILEDRSSYRPGLFIIFSPIWINLEPDDYRPFMMLVMCRKTDQIIDTMANTVLAHRPNGRAIERLHAQIVEKRKRHSAGKIANGGGDEKRKEAGADPQPSGGGTGPEEPPLDDCFGEHAVTPYYLKSYTIRRSSIGRYLLFGAQYETLFDLVTHLANAPSPLPHQLDGGPTQPMGLYFDVVPPPCKQPKRDLWGVPMECEKIAAKHFDQVTEPAILAQTFSFVYRSILDPLKASHAAFARAAGFKKSALDEATKYIQQFDRPTQDRPRPALESAEVTRPPVVPKLKSSVDAPRDESVMKALPGTMLDIQCLQFSEGDKLGAGAFGAVYRGKLTSPEGESDVAIKRLTLVAPEKDVRQAWISEMEILQLVCHPNIARFHGFCYDDQGENVLLAFELMGLGSLSDYLKGREFNTTANEQIDFMMQIARGVGHLHSFDPPILHGDLACRNVLMSYHPTDQTRFLIKVTDFGLSKTVRHGSHVYPDDPDKIPFKWLPPEVLHRREMSVKADVWAYGITATEIYGVQDPYGLLGAEKVLPLCNDGHRMEKPGNMPHYIYDIVLKCWRFQPQDRPSLEHVHSLLEALLIEFETPHMESVITRLSELEKQDVENMKNR